MGWLSIIIPAAIALFKLAYDQSESRRQSIIDEKHNSDQVALAEKQLNLNEKTSQQNFDLSKEQFEYQKQLNELTMQREDNAIQRQVADLKAAGLSPLMAAGGSSATPLQSAQPVQKDISGINTALSNMIGAYNDINNRRLNRQQFAMQNKLQSAQTFANILETSAQIKKAKLENKILDLDYKYYLNHPERNLGLQSVIINALERIISRNSSANIPGFPKIDLPDSSGSNPGNGGLLFDLITDPEKVKEEYNIPTPRFISGKPKEITQEDIDKDLNIIEKSQKKRVDEAIITVNLKKDFYTSAKIIWDYTNASDYYKDYETFLSVLADKTNKTKYLNTMKIQYRPRKRLELGS